MAANLDWLGLLQVTLLEGHNLVLTMRFAWKLLDQDHLLVVTEILENAQCPGAIASFPHVLHTADISITPKLAPL